MKRIYRKGNIFTFFYLLFGDLIKRFNKNRPVHIFGIYGFFGLPGKGKTVALAELGLRYREKYRDRIYIIDNFNYKYSDYHFDSKDWQVLLKEYDKPVLFLFDEIQNIFNSRDFKNFPVELLTLLTQNRKGNGKMICYTAQRWNRVDKVFRELTVKCFECKTILWRWTRCHGYDWEDYENYVNSSEVSKRMKIHRRCYSFIQTEQIRNSYDSYAMLKSASDKLTKGENVYMSREDIELRVK